MRRPTLQLPRQSPARPSTSAKAADAFKTDPVIVALFGALNRTFLDARTAVADFSTLFSQSRSSSIAITSDNSLVVVANRQKNSVSIIRVRAQNGADVEELLVELAVEKEPRFVAISPDDKRAYVTTAVGGSMSVIDLTATPKPTLVGEPVFVGLEPRGFAITPSGKYAFVALHTMGHIAVVDLTKLETQHFIETGGNPQAVAITNDGDGDDSDERVYVTRMFGELITPTRPDGFDDAKQGVIDTFTVGAGLAGQPQVEQINIRPLASGFNADRRQFCQATRDQIEGTVLAVGTPPLIFFNSGADGAANINDRLANPTFCPNVNSQDASAAGEIGRVAQQVYPNMLFAALVRGRKLYVPNEGASPEPPVRFNVNVQALVGVVDRTQGSAGVEDTNLSLNLNAQVAKEVQPPEANAKDTLDRVFLNDMVAMDADRSGRNFLFVSRGGNYVIRAGLDGAGKLNILDSGTPQKAQRLQTGNLPTGVAMSSDGTRAYANNELNTSVTALDLTNNVVLKRDMNSSTPPAPGTQEHRNLVGKLVFFTALGVPDVLDANDDGQFDVALRDIDPLKHRGKASDNGWSSCASCHDDGHSDNVTWIFETGPRQTIPLEGMFSHDVEGVAARLLDQRVLNWSAVRGSNTDFNQNAIGIQGGKGFATETLAGNRSGLVFNHGPVFGISDSLDALQEWVTTVRAPIVPQFAGATEGRVVFEEHCSSCHGGAKWTKSRTTPLYAVQPATASGLDAVFPENPIGAGFFNVVGGVIVGVKPFDAGLATERSAAAVGDARAEHAHDPRQGRDVLRARLGRRANSRFAVRPRSPRPGSVHARLRRLRRARIQYAFAAGPEHLGAVSPRRLGADAGSGDGQAHPRHPERQRRYHRNEDQGCGHPAGADEPGELPAHDRGRHAAGPVRDRRLPGAEHAVTHRRLFARDSDWPYSRPRGFLHGELASKNHELRVAALVQAATGAHARCVVGTQSHERRPGNAGAARSAHSVCDCGRDRR